MPVAGPSMAGNLSLCSWGELSLPSRPHSLPSTPNNEANQKQVTHGAKEVPEGREDDKEKQASRRMS